MNAVTFNIFYFVHHGSDDEGAMHHGHCNYGVKERRDEIEGVSAKPG